jgi:hypothetical protein
MIKAIPPLSRKAIVPEARTGGIKGDLLSQRSNINLHFVFGKPLHGVSLCYLDTGFRRYVYPVYLCEPSNNFVRWIVSG